MSDGISVKIGADISELERKAGQIPDVIDRAARKGKSRRFGDFTEGYYDVGPDRIRSAGRLPSMERSAYEMGQDRAAQEAQDKKFKSELKWNSAIQSDADKAAAQQASAAEKQQAKEEQQTEAWHRAELARKLKEQKDLAAAEEKRLKEEEARKEKERKLSNADYLKRLKWNSKLLEDENKRAEEAAKAAEWGNQFGKALESRLIGAFGPAAIAMKVIELGWGSVVDGIKDIYMTRGLKVSSGIDPMNARAAEVFSGLGTASDAEAISALKNAQEQVQAIAAGSPNANATGFNYFGFNKDDILRMRKEGVNFGELNIAMAKRFKEEGGSERFRAAAASIYGENWRSLGVIQAEAYADRIGFKKPGDVQTDIEGFVGKGNQRMRAWQLQQRMIDTLTPGELMGGLGGGTKQALANVTSLQAMGGGDILSAIARGPQERTATAAENIDRNMARVADSLTGAQAKQPTQPAIIGR